MAKSPKDDIDFFRRANISAVQRVLKRARENELKHKRRPKLTMTIKTGLLDKALDLALRHNGRTAKNQPSIRYTAPTTGGRPFHFGYTTVNKNDPKNRAKSKAADGAKQAATSGKPAGKSRAAQKVAHRSLEAAHQHYTERDSAVERDKQEVDPELLDKLKGMDRATDAAEQNQGQGEEAGPEQSGGYDAHGRLRDAGSEKQEPDNLLDHEQETNPERPKNGIGRNRDDNIDPDQEQPSSDQAKDKTKDGPDSQQNMNTGTTGAEPSEPSPERKATRDAAGQPMTALEFVEESGRNIPGIAEASSEAAAQRYIESPEKIAKIMGTTSSFGTIGRTLEERMDFWDLVNEHEREVDARTQSRLVVELPHEANAKHRHEIVRRFVSEFERKGIPYWASIHEPTEDNDSRNYHAHIVFTDRPMKMMVHPQTGELTWDFTIGVEVKDSSRHTRVRHPYRQNRDPEMRGKAYIKQSRERFSDIVNDVMVGAGLGVRYDPRSYKDMGLDVKPMNNVSRILLDKSKRQKFVVMDEEWTRRMIDTEMQNAAIRRDETYQKLQDTQLHLDAIARDPSKVAAANRKLPRHLRLSPSHILGRNLAGKLATKMLETERDRLTTLFVDEATERTLKRVIDSTAPIRSKKGMAQIYPGSNAPDPESLAALHEAAIEEMKIFRATRPIINRKFKHQKLKAETEWQIHAQPRPPEHRPRGPAETLKPAASPANDTPPTKPSQILFRDVQDDPWRRRENSKPATPADHIARQTEIRAAIAAHPLHDEQEDMEYRRRAPNAGPRPNPFGSIQKQMEHFYATPQGARMQDFMNNVMSGLESVPGAEVPGAIRTMLDAKAEENKRVRLITEILNQEANRPAPHVVRDIAPHPETKPPERINHPKADTPSKASAPAPDDTRPSEQKTTAPQRGASSPPRRSPSTPGQPELPGFGTEVTQPIMHEATINLAPGFRKPPEKPAGRKAEPPAPTDAAPKTDSSRTETPKPDQRRGSSDKREHAPATTTRSPDISPSSQSARAPKGPTKPDEPKNPGAIEQPQQRVLSDAEKLQISEAKRKRRKAILAEKNKGFDR